MNLRFLLIVSFFYVNSVLAMEVAQETEEQNFLNKAIIDAYHRLDNPEMQSLVRVAKSLATLFQPKSEVVIYNSADVFTDYCCQLRKEIFDGDQKNLRRDVCLTLLRRAEDEYLQHLSQFVLQKIKRRPRLDRELVSSIQDLFCREAINMKKAEAEWLAIMELKGTFDRIVREDRSAADVASSDTLIKRFSVLYDYLFIKLNYRPDGADITKYIMQMRMILNNLQSIHGQH